MTASDIESLQPRAGSRGRCLHAFLITSVITLFVLLSGVTVTAALFIRQIQTELANFTKPTHEPTGVMSYARMLKSEYKVQNFAFVRASSGKLDNGNMLWKAESSETVGSGYEFSKIQHTLQPQAEGSYLLYLDLVLHCRHSEPMKCGPIDVVVHVNSGNQHHRSLLECQVSGPQRRAEKCWEVVRLGSEHRLVALMEARGDIDSWELNTEQSGMGMFLVDGQTR